MLIFGHGNLEPDNLLNSRESFAIVRDSGADGVELDVRVTADGAMVVMHDPEFPDGGSVSRTLAEDRPSNVVLLDEALDLCEGLTVNIEIKNYPSDPGFDPTERLADLVIDLLEQRRGKGHVLISCFGIASLKKVRDRRPDIPVAHLLFSRKSAAEVLQPCIDNSISTVHPYAPMVDEEFCNPARDNGISINVWTGFEESEDLAKSVFSQDVDGLITPYPARAVRLRDAS